MIKEPCILDAEWEKEIGKRAIKEADWAEFIPLIDACELATALDTSYRARLCLRLELYFGAENRRIESSTDISLMSGQKYVQASGRHV